MTTSPASIEQATVWCGSCPRRRCVAVFERLRSRPNEPWQMVYRGGCEHVSSSFDRDGQAHPIGEWDAHRMLDDPDSWAVSVYVQLPGEVVIARTGETRAR